MSDTLRGLRILDLTRMLAGPYATMLLADMGAEVIKVEDPDGGDPMRRMGPPFEPDGRSAYFMAVNRNKKSVALDLRSDDGRRRFLGLVRTADAVVDNFRPGVMERLGLAPARLREVRPDLVTCSLTAFGADGPYRDLPAYDLVLQAMGGGMSITGEPGGTPTRSGIPIGDLGGGAFAALAVCAALLRRERTGLGQHVDLSLLDVQVSLLTYVAQYFLTDGRVPGPMGSAHQSVVPYQAFRTADGHVVIAVFGESFWPPLCRVLGLQELVERWPDNRSRYDHRDEVIACLERRLLERTTGAWVADLWAAGVPSGPVNALDRVLADPQIRHRGMLAHDGERPLLGNPVRTGAPDEFRPAPALGQHTSEFLS
ncbi:MAG TPA: CoA transferase [Candidatus Dormibacteraeota bacterium]|nr:CoA transferase [Candidatus Dormibacteraeota bacterium]